jgi:phosphatidylglycerophosphate synthase
LLVAAASDLLDGIWARRLGGSRLGAVLGPVCDKVFMAAGFFVVLRSGLLAPLEIVGVLLRDIVAVLGFIAVKLLRHPSSLPARAGGKAVTVCQLLTLGAFILRPDLVRPLAWATVAISVYAIADYSRAAWRQ